MVASSKQNWPLLSIVAVHRRADSSTQHEQGNLDSIYFKLKIGAYPVTVSLQHTNTQMHFTYTIHITHITRATRRCVPEHGILQVGLRFLPSSTWFLACHILRPWKRRQCLLSKLMFTFTTIYGVIFKELELSMVTAFKVPYPQQLLSWFHHFSITLCTKTEPCSIPTSDADSRFNSILYQVNCVFMRFASTVMTWIR
jgi:hypothetical protein